MRDIKLYFTENNGFDINVEKGYPEEVAGESQSQDQRAAIGAVFEAGTMPGNLSFGVRWSALYEQEKSMIDISNDVQNTVSQVAGGDGQELGTYLPMFVPEEDGSVSVTVVKGAVQ